MTHYQRIKQEYQEPLREIIKAFAIQGHSLGCQLADEGYSIDFIQDVYKHTSIKTTLRYAKRQRGMISDALENRCQVVAFRSSLEAENKK